MTGFRNEQTIDVGTTKFRKVVGTVPAAVDVNGDAFDPDSMAQTLGYTGSQLTTISVTDGTNTWTQTLTYTGANLTGISKWVKS